MSNLQYNAIIATASGDCGNRAAIAVEVIRRHNLALQLDQAEYIKRCLKFAAVVDRYRGQRQAQPGDIGRDHYPGPRNPTL